MVTLDSGGRQICTSQWEGERVRLVGGGGERPIGWVVLLGGWYEIVQWSDGKVRDDGYVKMTKGEG